MRDSYDSARIFVLGDWGGHNPLDGISLLLLGFNGLSQDGPPCGVTDTQKL